MTFAGLPALERGIVLLNEGGDSLAAIFGRKGGLLVRRFKLKLVGEAVLQALPMT